MKYVIIMMLFLVGCFDSNIEGCTQEGACNYSWKATVDDGSCSFVLHEWMIKISAEMLAWNIVHIEDIENYIGVSESATDGYDMNLDFPEPPNNPGNYISLYFSHPEWENSFGDNFTSDIKSSASSCGISKQWDIKLYSNSVGPCTLIFDFLDEVDFSCDSSPLVMIIDETSYNICDGFSQTITLTDNTVKNITIILTP